MDGAGINLFPVNLVEALKNRKVQIGIAAVAVLLAVALTLVWVLQPKNDNPQAGATASSSGTADGAAVTSPEASSPPASPGACVTPDAAGFVPVRYSIESIGVEDKVIYAIARFAVAGLMRWNTASSLIDGAFAPSG